MNQEDQNLDYIITKLTSYISIIKMNHLSNIYQQVKDKFDDIVNFLPPQGEKHNKYSALDHIYTNLKNAYPLELADHFYAQIHQLKDIKGGFKNLKNKEFRKKIKTTLTKNIEQWNKAKIDNDSIHSQETIVDQLINDYLQNPDNNNIKGTIYYTLNKANCFLKCFDFAREKQNYHDYSISSLMKFYEKTNECHTFFKEKTLIDNFIYGISLNTTANFLNSTLNYANDYPSSVYITDSGQLVDHANFTKPLNTTFSKANCINNLYKAAAKVTQAIIEAMDEKIASKQYGKFFVAQEIYFPESQQVVELCLDELSQNTILDSSFNLELDSLKTYVLGAIYEAKNVTSSFLL